MYEEQFPLRLAQLRVLKGVSARDMSLSLGQNAGYINNIESGKALPSMSNFFYGNTAQIAYRESHSKLVCRAASIIPSVRLAGRINSGCQAGPVSQDQVRQSEQHIQFSGLLPQATVPCLSVSEPTLDHREYVFHFRANR